MPSASKATKAIDPFNTVPKNAAELERCLADPMWRICSGQLYQIMLKSPEDGSDATVVPFKPNDAQLQFLRQIWHRNIILKARQRGFTTLIAILYLDHALFNADQRCGIVAQDLLSAGVIFRDKVQLAYNRMPPEIKATMPLLTERADELLFKHNNSSIRVATSMRSGTIHRLHVSEFGKICAKYPDKAKEVVTGSLPAVPVDGISIIESTAEGRDGDFYKMTQRAIALQEADSELTKRDYRFHFYSWWDDDGYQIYEGHVVITEKDHEYFDKLEIEVGQKISLPRRRWYIATCEADFSGDREKMWQEYPSTHAEAFQVSTEGKWYAAQMVWLRKNKRITTVPHVEGIPVNTFWDIGNGDGTGIWLHQRVDLQDRFLRYIEGWNEPYSFFTKQLQQTGYLWGKHHLPHDAEHERQQADKMWSAKSELQKSNIGGEWVIVPRVDDLTVGINVTRAAFSRCWFDEEGCKAGLLHLENYGKRWNSQSACWSDTPKKDIHTEAADSIRQFAQGYQGESESIGYTRNRDRNWKTA